MHRLLQRITKRCTKEGEVQPSQVLAIGLHDPVEESLSLGREREESPPLVGGVCVPPDVAVPDAAVHQQGGRGLSHLQGIGEFTEDDPGIVLVAAQGQQQGILLAGQPLIPGVVICQAQKGVEGNPKGRRLDVLLLAKPARSSHPAPVWL